MKCPHCGKELADDAVFCRYCGNKTETVESAPKKRRGRILLATLVVILLVAAAAVYFIKIYEPTEYSDSVEKVELQDTYSLEADTITLSPPEVEYTDGKKETLRNYTVYIDDQKCAVEDGKVSLPENRKDGKCRLRVEWKKAGQTEYCEKTVELKAQGQSAGEGESSPEVNTVGNTPGNLVCDGLLAQQGEWLYYSTRDALYKTKEIGTEEELLCEGESIRNINVVGEWIYFTDHSSGVFRMKTDGTENTCLYENTETMACEELAATDDQLFLRMGNDTEYGGWLTGDIYIMNPDGTGKNVFKSGDCALLGIQDKHLYFTENGEVKQIRLDGIEEKTIYSALPIWSEIVVDDGWLYCAVNDETSSTSCMLSKINIESGQRQSLCEVEASESEVAIPLNVRDGWIYYTRYNWETDDGGSPTSEARVTTEGESGEILFSTESTAYPFVTDSGVYIQDITYDAGDWENVNYVWKKVENVQ